MNSQQSMAQRDFVHSQDMGRRYGGPHEGEIHRKADHLLAPNIPPRSPPGDARLKNSVFANAARGLTGDNVRKLTSYWQRTITETEENDHDFKTHALPLARIKKVMKADEDVKMISAEAPILFAKACEIFINELTRRAWIHAEENKRRTLQRSDIANAISRSDMFDFLIDIVPREEFVASSLNAAEAGPDAQPVAGAAGGFMGMALGHAIQAHPGNHQADQRHNENDNFYAPPPPTHKPEDSGMNGHYQHLQHQMGSQHRQPLLGQHQHPQDPHQQQQQQHNVPPQHNMYDQQRYSMPGIPPMTSPHPSYLEHINYHPGYNQHNPMHPQFGNPYSQPYMTQQHPPPLPHQHGRDGSVDQLNSHYAHR